GLVAAAERANPDLQIVDGQPARDVADDVMLIGFTGEPGEQAVTSARARQQGATAPDRERYAITCLSAAWEGQRDDPVAVREKAYFFIDALAAELARDQTLGGAVMTARISTDALAQAQTERGATAVVRFVVHVEAFTRSY